MGPLIDLEIHRRAVTTALHVSIGSSPLSPRVPIREAIHGIGYEIMNIYVPDEHGTESTSILPLRPEAAVATGIATCSHK